MALTMKTLTRRINKILYIKIQAQHRNSRLTPATAYLSHCHTCDAAELISWKDDMNL